MNKTRFIYILIAVLMCAGILLSGFYIIAESEHNCIGENCHICNMICICGDFLRHIAVCGMIALALIFAKAAGDFFGQKSYLLENSPYTLVSLKVEFRN